ncbi:MAG: Transcriptional regulator MraZ [Candidatus Anoxychlamydiales bacterium]|nr:Transcriptional regulator MraZ [Candidatus Anoxychlamydiales bacterium]
MGITKVSKMEQFFFSGSQTSKVDPKNRFTLPQKMRYGLVENGRLEFIIGLGLGGCLAIYRRSDIQKIVQKFQEKQHIAKYQKFFTLFFSTLHHTSCDSIGRVIIPNHLKQAIGIKKELVIAGVLNKIEIWPKELYDRNLSNLLQGKDTELDLAKMTEEAFALLDESKDAED